MDLNNIDVAVDDMMSIKGAIASAVIDWESGMTLGMKSLGNFDVELASAGNSEVVKAKMATMKSLGLTGDIKDMMITLTDQIHILSIVEDHPELCLYIALDSANSNLALARNQMQKIAKS
jgi:hypothetical protein